MAEYQKAKEAGDKKKIAEIGAWFEASQKRFHTQGYSTAPVDDILVHIKDQLLPILEKESVGALVSKFDEATLRQYPSVERVDVTMALVDAFHPNAKQRKSAIEVQRHKPISLEQASNIRH